MKLARRRSSFTLYGLGAVTIAILAALVMLTMTARDTHAQSSVPEAPTGLTATSVSHDSVTLGWDDPDDHSITGYQVLRQSRDGDEYGDGQGAAEFAAITDDTASSATTYTDTSVTARTRYVYRVKAINSEGTSEQSNYVNVETPCTHGDRLGTAG